MVERIAEIIVLAEDIRQANLVRHYMIRCGHHHRNIVLRVNPRGRGVGEHVRERYPIEVIYYRVLSHRRKAALAVVLDADIGTVEGHERELAILCLTGDAVDEIMNYKGRERIDGLIKPAAVRLYEWSRDGADVLKRCVPSLRRALGEVRRIG